MNQTLHHNSNAGGQNDCLPVSRDLVYQRLSAIAYQDEDTARINVIGLGYKYIEHVHDPVTGADAIVVRNDCQIVIAFRGTQKNHADIITDLKFKKHEMMLTTGDRKIPVHRGFLAQWNSIKAELRAIVCEASKNTSMIPVFVTGHSLGGALAILAALDWPWLEGCITFGAPRVGGKEIEYAIRRNEILHRRYVYGADVVPIVPLLAMGYRHDCRPIYLTRNAQAIRNCPLWRELIGRSRSLLSLDWSAGWSACPVPSRMFTDHRIGEYGHAMSQCP